MITAMVIVFILICSIYVFKVNSKVDRISENLCNPKTRGAWGETTAKNCLDKIGLTEDIDYFCQKTTEDGKRPDFTIKVTDTIVCNMDSKFPLTNYLEYVDKQTEESKEQFFKDVKARLKEVASKGYIDPSNNTTDFAICFIPNEQLIEFITEHDSSIVEYAVAHKIVICTPWTLYSIISLFKQVNSTLKLLNDQSEIVKNILQFKKEWEAYKTSQLATFKKIESVYSEFDSLNGVRSRQLDKSFKKLGI